MNIIDNDLLSMQEARILVEIAVEAQKQLVTFSQEKLDLIVERMFEEVNKHSDELARLATEETECGNLNDKLIKDEFINVYLKKRIRKMKCVGIIERDDRNKTIDIGVPIGVIVAFCPFTSPVSTLIYNAVIAIKSGNTIIFSPHIKAKKVMMRTLDILIRAAEGYGLPEGALSYIKTLSYKGSKELVNHKGASLIINTGVSELLEMIQKSGKHVIYGGAGHGPAFIERTANVKKAVEDIVSSKTFDYGVMPGAEQSIVVDSPIVCEVRNELEKQGAYFMSDSEAELVEKLLFSREGKFDNEFIGKSAYFIGTKAGLNIDSNIKLLIVRQKYVSLDNVHAREKLCPVISFYVEDDWMNACEKCIELLLNEREGHTLIIHSKDEEVIKQFALKKPVGRILVNTSGVFGSMGATTNLFPALTLGSGLVGKGMTSDNVSPMNLIYVRKVGHEICDKNEFIDSLKIEKKIKFNKADNKGDDSLKKIQDILLRLLDESNKKRGE